MNAIKNRVEYLKENGYNFDISTIIEKAFEYWKKIILPTLLVSVIGAALLFLFYALFLNQYFGGIDNYIALFTSGSQEELRNLSKSFDYISKTSILNFIIAIIISPLLAGLLLCIREVDVMGSTNAATVFKGFSGAYIGNILGYAIVLNIVTIAISLGLSYWYPDTGGIFSIIISFIIYALSIFVLPLILFGEMNFFKAIFSSIVLSFKKFGMIFLLIIIGFFIVIVPSILTCGLGFLVFHSMFSALTYSSYKEVVGFEEDNEVSEIGKTP